ncbi:MAG: hypothetical protein AAGA90_21870 [Actinomycetota bacterium]
MGSAPVMTADQFLSAVQAGDTKQANAAADAAVRDPAADDRTVAWAALTYLHTGRFDGAKKLGKRLADSSSAEALWARSALAIAFTPARAPELLARLAPLAEGTPEYALLSGVCAHQQGHTAEGDRWLSGIPVNPQSVFATAAALGMRRRANQGLGRRVVQVLCAVVGTAVLGVIGLALGLLAAAALNRRALKGKTTGAAHALLSIATPRETHTAREWLVMTGKVVAGFAVVIAIVVVAVQIA